MNGKVALLGAAFLLATNFHQISAHPPIRAELKIENVVLSKKR